jgi:hypothetical protein
MEIRSPGEFLGLPLVHVAIGGYDSTTYRRGVAVGWLAIGDVAIGALFSAGGVAIGGLSLGGVSLGVLAFGGCAIGAAAFGGLAIGMLALGGAAIAWWIALGGAAISHNYAVGGAAIAPHVTTAFDRNFLNQLPPQAPFRPLDAMLLLAIALALLWIVYTARGRWWEAARRDPSSRRQ